MKVKCRKKIKWVTRCSFYLKHLVCLVSACSSKSCSVLYQGHSDKKTNKKPVLPILQPLRQEISLLMILFSAVRGVCLAAPGVHCIVRGLSPLTGDQTQTPCAGGMESAPLGHQGSPSDFLSHVHIALPDASPF